MWRRTYLLLLVVRLYFAFCPSYLHPDENFQGPEVIAGQIFGYPVHKTWEFTSDRPIRSVLPLWIVYGLPMLVLRWLWEGSGHGAVPPAIVFWTLRLVMFSLSFVLEDWAVHELIESPSERRVATLLVASSYVTWTWQAHTFSNSLETLLVLWSLVLIKRIVHDQRRRTSILAPAIFASVTICGIFTRVTFPAFLLAPGLQMIPLFRRRPLILIVMLFAGAMTALFAILVDTSFYTYNNDSFRHMVRNPVLTPYNNLAYNLQSSNLATHGIHPIYQHLLINLPQFLGPALPLFLFSSRGTITLASTLSGVTLLSLFPHQEARFLLPAVPLILSSIRIPRRFTAIWLSSWVLFNATLGILMGVYHQAGVVPAQIFLQRQANVTAAFWWRTYSPPIWLLDGRSADLTTVDLMGMDGPLLESRLCDVGYGGVRVLVAPRAEAYLDRFVGADGGGRGRGAGARDVMRLEELWSTRRHIGLDGLEFGEDGVWETLRRVVGRRGLCVWRIECAGERR